MAIWDKLDTKDFDAFKEVNDAKLVAINTRLQELASQLAEKTPELVEEVRAAAAQVASDRDAIRQTAEEAENILSILTTDKADVDTALNTLKAEITDTRALYESLKAGIAEAQAVRSDLASSKAKTDANVAEIAANLEKSKGLLKQAEDVPAQIEAAAKLLKQSEELRDNIQGLVDHSIGAKKQIDDALNEIYGQDVKDSEGKVERVEGLRDKIKKSFDQVNNDLGKLKERANNDITKVTTELKALMPGAMAAGLSAAYEAKANTEIKSLEKLEGNFFYSILGLIVISSIPVAIDIYLLAHGKDLIEVIKLTPVLQILPLYFPALWFAYSTSKKVNLSKRLIEEYTHKAVLGKTFSGLSNQIDSLPPKDDEVRQDLRTRLLYNVLQVSAENPGKLITDYNKADHPVVEALEKSSILSDSIDTLERIPGFSRLAKFFTDRLATLEAEQAKKVEEGLDAVKAATGGK